MSCIYGLREQIVVQNATWSFQAPVNYCVCDTHLFLNNTFTCQDAEKHFPLDRLIQASEEKGFKPLWYF